jgi:hypothetical protein
MEAAATALTMKMTMTVLIDGVADRKMMMMRTTMMVNTRRRH